MPSPPTLECPNCQFEIKLDESLAAPLIAATRQDYEKKLAEQSAGFAKQKQALQDREDQLTKEREAVDDLVATKVKQERDKLTAEASRKEKAVADREAALEQQRQTLEDTLAQRLKAERSRIADDEARKARQALGDDLDARSKELAELQTILKQRDDKLAEAQKAQAELVRKERQLEDAQREMELTIEQQVSGKLTAEREKAEKAADEKHALRLIEKDEKMASLQRKIEELQKKAEQGSQQLQGEALEIQLESMLAARFPHDRIEAVPKGEHGGDILQRVMTPTGTAGGTILWETKRTKNWSDGWLAKLREDQRQAKAEVAAIISVARPKDCDSFDQIDGVWVIAPHCVVPVAMTLRQTLMEVSAARQVGEGQQTKTQMLYQYLTGPKFRLRVQAIVEAFTDMEADLAKEKKAITRQWAKRETQITRVMEATVGMYGEMQGIAGKSVLEIEGLEIVEDDLPKQGLLNDE